MNFDFNWPKVHGFESSKGSIKTENEDFKVVERLPEIPSGEGEHLWLTIEKNGQNTAWVARQIAKWANVKPRDVSYAGLKDRHAVTQQTFSVHLPGQKEPSPRLLHVDGVKVLSAIRHTRKLKIGQLVGNHFEIRVRNCNSGIETLETNWHIISKQGVPNYFGPQRFGFDGQNVIKGQQWLLGEAKAPRQHQSIYLSAVRSYLFNQLLANRVIDGTWNKLVDGDFAQFTEGKAGFYSDEVLAKDIERCQLGELSPCASMPGESRDEFLKLDERETAQLENFADLLAALQQRRVSRHFRKLRVFPEKTSFMVVDGDPVFGFFLPAGCFATSVLAELISELDVCSGATDWNE